VDRRVHLRDLRKRPRASVVHFFRGEYRYSETRKRLLIFKIIQAVKKQASKDNFSRLQKRMNFVENKYTPITDLIEKRAQDKRTGHSFSEHSRHISSTQTHVSQKVSTWPSISLPHPQCIAANHHPHLLPENRTNSVL
jgi:hypothetical protein